MIDDSRIADLRFLLGERGLLTDPGALAVYETSARHDKGRAAFVARPTSTEETAKVLSYCVRHGISLVPQSGNTGLVSGSTPDGSAAQGVLSLDRLTAPFVLDRTNRSLVAGAGLRLSEVNRRLEETGLFFPIDVGADPCLGGMLATNTGGSRFLRYGDMRHNALGLTVVLGDGEGSVLKLGSGLRKNNTGPDWKHVFIGTSGSFGVITECVLNLEPRPQQIATSLLVPAVPDNVSDLLLAMEAALGSYLSAFEGMSRNAMAAALAHVPSLRNPFPGGRIPDFAILVEASRSWAVRAGEQPIDLVLEEVLAGIWEEDAALLADAFIGPPREIWALRHALSEGVQRTGHLIAFDLSFHRGDLMRFLSHMKVKLPQKFPNVSICDFGHVGDGGVHFNLVLSGDDPRRSNPEFEMQLREWVFGVTVEEFGGSFSAEHAIGRKNQVFYDRYTPSHFRRLAAGLKAITSPGSLGSVLF